MPTNGDLRTIFEDERVFNQYFDFSDMTRAKYEALNSNFINTLTNHIVSSADRNSGGAPAVILEVGAGDGRLSGFIRQRLWALGIDDISVIATDSGEWEITPEAEVITMDQAEAVQQYKPDIVISSWMPMQVDFTADFRTQPSVKEYILIGEVDHGCCGDQNKTWGAGSEQAAYQKDGFLRNDLTYISEKQICRTDWHGAYIHSRTVSFLRSLPMLD